MDIDSVANIVRNNDVVAVTITGGEPMLDPAIKELVSALIECGKQVNIETNGSVPLIKNIGDTDKVFYTMDYKLPSSGMEREMILDNLSFLLPEDVLKFVVSDKADFDRATEILRTYPTAAQVFFSPVFGRIEFAELAEMVKTYGRGKFQLQLHKIIWPNITRGV